jgi:hypothetical protein
MPLSFFYSGATMKENSWKVSDTSEYDYSINIGSPGGGGGPKSLLNQQYLASQLPKEDIFMPNYKFNEDRLLAQLRMYIDKTYTQHYSQNKIQATEFIIDAGHGVGFTLGNVIKYAQRYGKKEGFNRQDLLKVLHYAIIALHVHDITNPNKEQK